MVYIKQVKRDKQIHLSVSEEEKETLKKWAQAQSITISDVLRNHIWVCDKKLDVLRNHIKDFELKTKSSIPRGFCRPCNIVRIHENGRCSACGEWVILDD